MNLKNHAELKKPNNPPKNANCVIPIIQNSRKHNQVYDKKMTSGCLGTDAGERGLSAKELGKTSAVITVVVFTQLRTFVQTHQTVHLKLLNFYSV